MTSIVCVDVTAGLHADALTDLIDMHQRWFAEHGHVVAELRQNAVGPVRRGNVILHQVVAYCDGVPAGFIIVHTNLLRAIGLIHFLAVEPEFRHGSGHPTAGRLVEAAVELVRADFLREGVASPYGLVAESSPERIAGWQRWGFQPLGVDYAEPFFGMHWAQHGEPTFFSMTLVHLADAVDDNPGAARAAVEAFLLDHYRLPATHERVRRSLATA